MTRRTLLGFGGGLLGLVGAGFLAACGGTTARSVPAASTDPSAVAAAAPTAPSAPVAASATPAVPGASSSSPLVNGIPQGRTPDGFPFLGRPDAPVTVIDYSDFL